MKKTILFIFLLSIGLTLAACTQSVEHKEEIDYSNRRISIYTTQTQESSFYRMYGNFIIDKFPGLEIDLILPSNRQGWTINDDGLTKQPPDLIMSYTSDHMKLANQSYLTDLNSFIKMDDFNTNPYQEEMIQMFSDQNGALYGLSPQAFVSGVFYNKELFDKERIDYPVAGMDWYELLQLASRFTDGVAGYESTSNPASLLMNIPIADNWKLINKEQQTITFNEQDWLKAIQTIVDLYRSKSVIEGRGKSFFEGNSALYKAHISAVNELNQTNTFQWGFVPLPVNTNERNVSRSVFFNEVISIPNQSTQKELAWDIAKALMSEEAAEYYAESHNMSAVSTLRKYQNEYNGIQLESFWDQKIELLPDFDVSQFSGEFIDDFYKGLSENLDKAIRQEISVEQCLAFIIEASNEAFALELMKGADAAD